MNFLDDVLEVHQSSHLNRVRVLDTPEDRDQLSIMFKRQEESCKLETDGDQIDQQEDISQQAQIPNMKSNLLNLQSDNTLNIQSQRTEKENLQLGSKGSSINITPQTTNNYISYSGKASIIDQLEQDGDNGDNQQKNIFDMLSSQMIDTSNQIHTKKASKFNRFKLDNSLQMLSSSQQNLKLGGNTGNAQKELMNRFLMLYAKQKNQITTLDAIVILKIKLKGFFEKYTYSGRYRQIKKNLQIRKSINDQSDGQLLMQNQGIFGKFEWLSTQIKKYIFKYSEKFSLLSRILFYFLGLLKRFIRFSQGQISSVEFFKPHHTLLLAFNMICIVINSLFLFFLSILMVFDDIINIHDEVINYYFIGAFVIWVIEFFVRINTAEIFRMDYIQNRLQIFKQYVKSGFILDFIPLFTLLVSTQYSQFRPFIFLKYFGLRKDVEKVEKKLLMRLNKHYYIQMVNLAANIFIFGHLIGLMYYATAVIELNYFHEETSWLDTRIAVEGLWYKTYLQSLYWSFTLLTTGSNEVETWQEMFFTTFIMMYTGVIFAYIFNTIGNIITEMNLGEEEKKKDINIINNYMRRRKISRELQHKANEDLEFFYQTSFKKQSDEEKEVLSKISIELTNKMQLEYNRKIINKIKVLTENFSSTSIDQLCLKIEEQFYSPNQIIIESNDSLYECPSLIFIVSGSGKQFSINKICNLKVNNEILVEIFEKITLERDPLLNQNENQKEEQVQVSVLKEYQKGQIIGETNFFNGQSMKISVRSQDFTTVLKIERELFQDIIKNNQRDFQKFSEIKDKLTLYSELKPLNLQCSICNSSNHLQDDCPLSHFRIENPFLLARHNKSSDQERDGNYSRKEKCKFDAYIDMYLICNSVNRIIDQIQIDSQQDQIYSSLSNLIDDENYDEDEDEENDDPNTEKQNYSKQIKENSLIQPINQNSSQLSVLPPQLEQQQPQLLSYKSRRASRDHSFLFQQEKNFLQNQLSYHNPSYQQFDSYQILANNNEPYSGLAMNVDKPSSSLNSGQQILQKIDEYPRESSNPSLKETQSQPIFLRRRKEQTLITQLKNLLKDPTQFSIKEESIKSHSQSKNNKQVQKNVLTVPVENQYLNLQNIEKIKQQNFYWYFDLQKDYLYYFSDGNMFTQIQKYNNMKKKLRDRFYSIKGEAISPLKKMRKSIKIRL